MLQARYALPTPVLERGRTMAGYAAAAAATRFKRCVAAADAANACYLAADLLASGAGVRLVEALVELVADARFLISSIALGVAHDVADLGELFGAEAKGGVANDASARHLAVQAVVRLCLLASRGGSSGTGARALTFTRAGAAKLSALQADVVPLLKSAPPQQYSQEGGGGLMARVASALSLLRTAEGEATRLLVVSLVSRSAPASVPALAALAGSVAGPHARVALALMALARGAGRPSLLLAAFAGPGPLEAPAWTRAERANVTYAVLRSHVLFESLAADHEEATAAVLEKVRGGSGARVDPDVARSIDATFRRRARLDALYRV